MTVPAFVPKANKLFMGKLAGRVPPFAELQHQGRKSGTLYTTPVVSFRHEDEVVICLPYGTDVDWLQNVRANGVANLVVRNQTFRLTEPRVVHSSPDEQPLPAVLKTALKAARTEDFVHFHVEREESPRRA